jgi:hypothetical protein
VLERWASADEQLDAGERIGAIAFDSGAPEPNAALATSWDATTRARLCARVRTG